MNTQYTYTNLTAGEIIDVLSKVSRDAEIHIEGHIFYRWKWRGKNLLALELNTVDEIRHFQDNAE